jgi:adenylate cyclase class IV
MPIEIEIKSLLGEATRAEALRAELVGRGALLTETSAQLNHYFTGDALPALAEVMRGAVSEADLATLRGLVGRARKSSVRTRLLNQTVLLIVKAALDDTTSANGITRLEYEAEAHGLTLDQLDSLVVSAGYAVQAKWSRQRQTYRLGDVSVSLDKNAGYGYLAEFEVMADDEGEAPALTDRLRALMAALGTQELAQDRLERMFAHYNAHWREYYGTDNTFTVE